jgi:hypothetical protein
MSAGEGLQNHEQQNHFLEVCRAAARVVNMGGSTSGLTHFSAAQAAFEGSMTVSVVQRGGEVLADLKT